MIVIVTKRKGIMGIFLKPKFNYVRDNLGRNTSKSNLEHSYWFLISPLAGHSKLFKLSIFVAGDTKNLVRSDNIILSQTFSHFVAE